MVHLLHCLDCDLCPVSVVGHHVLVDVEGGQAEGDVVLQLGREPFLRIQEGSNKDIPN